MKTTFINLAAQAEKLRRHNRQGSYKTKERYYEAFLRFLRFTAERFHLEKLANLSGKHLAVYVADMQSRGCRQPPLKPSCPPSGFGTIRFQTPAMPCRTIGNWSWSAEYSGSRIGHGAIGNSI